MALRNITKQVKHPTESGEWFEFRIPGWRILEESKKIKTRQSMANIRDLGGDIYKAIQEARTGDAVASVAADPLDDDTAKWAARVIIGADEASALKNEPANSTVPSTGEALPPMNG